MGKVIITVTCDWDGLDYPLEEKYNPTSNPHFRFDCGIQALQYFTAIYKDRIPLTHFICPVYFTRSQTLAEYYADKISALIKNSRGEIGLHIHGWMSLMRACGVSPRDPVQDSSIPDWGEQEGDRYGLRVPYANDWGETMLDYGHGVPLGVYDLKEISRIAEEGRKLFVKNKILASSSECVSFRCGGWMANDTVFAALQAAEPPFEHEASAVDASFFAEKPGSLAQWLAKLWGANRQPENSFLANDLFLSVYPNGINICAQANNVTGAQPRKIQKLLQIPDTAILADYVNADYIKEQIDNAVAVAEQQSAEVYVSLGFHLESGGDPRFGKHFGHIEEVIAALEYVNEKYALADKIQYLTIAEAGRRFLRSHGFA